MTDVIIVDAVWIDVNVFVNPGDDIGDNTILSVNSIIAEVVPSFSIVGSVQASVIRIRKIDA